MGAYEDDIREGNSCLLDCMGQLFWVRILEAGDDAIRVSFPGYDYPLEGMSLALHFHTEESVRFYESRMTGRAFGGPQEGILLAKPKFLQGHTHRHSVRVHTDLTARVKDQVRMAAHDALVLNLSQGGALLQTSAPFDFDTTLELELTLPGEPELEMLGQVLHITHEGAPEDSQLLGVRFISPMPDQQAALARYIESKLAEEYPSI